jgi:Flp pilus assembly protein TadD
MVTAGAGEMPPKASNYHEALKKRPESATLFERFREAWLEEMPAEELEKELLSRAEAGEAGAWAVLGRARLAAAKEEAALEAFEKARAAAPGAWLNLEIGRLKLAAKDFEGAEKEALAVPAEDKLRPDALKLAGLACLRGGRIEEAQAHWEKAVAAVPGDKSLLEDLTELTRREGRLDLALEYGAEWRDAVGDDAYARALATLAMAELLEASQRHDDALAELGAVLRVSGDGSWLEREALSRVERAFRQRGDMTARAAWLGEVAEANPTRLNFRRAQAQALSEVGKTAEALEVLAAVLKRLPGDRDARWQRIGLLERDLKLEQAYDECAALAAEEKSEEAGLRRAELAFRLGRKEEVKQALDAVLAVADPAKRPALAGLYVRYGMPEESEKQWRAAAAGEQGGQALRELAKFLRVEKRDQEAIAVWQEIGARDSAADRMEAARMLAGAGERKAARDLLESGRDKYGTHPGYEEARAELALMEDRNDEALEIYRALALKAERLDELSSAWRGWLAAAAGREEELIATLGDGPVDRCLRMAWLAREGKPLPEVEGELERAARLVLLKENGRWAEAVAMMEARPGSGALYFRELGEAKEAAGDADGALAAVRAWRERSPDQAGPWVKEANLLDAAGDGAGAERLLRRAVARFEDDPDAPRRLFSLLEEKGEIGTALDFAWQRHDRAEEESARAGWLREIIRVSREGERLEELKGRFEERARRDPASPGPQRALAELAKARGDSRAEMEHLRKAADAAPRDVELVSALAAIEERNGQMERALERHAALAKLVPGVDSAMKLAQAKIRCGDIEGGMRDMQMLAGDEGLDLRELEKSLGALATSGHMDEAIRMLEALDPARFDARLHFVRGVILEAAGRPEEALEDYLKVMAEPADPAETPQARSNAWDPNLLMNLLRQTDSDSQQVPGFIRYFMVPGSLVQTKAQLAPKLLRMAMELGDEAWAKTCRVIPKIGLATPLQWRQALEFAAERENGYSGRWWQFALEYPDHPLASELMLNSGGFHGMSPEQAADLLDGGRELSVEVQIGLRLIAPGTADELAEWSRGVDPGVWKDEQHAARAMQLLYRVSAPVAVPGQAEPAKAPEGWVDCLAVLEAAEFTGSPLVSLRNFQARRDLEKGDHDGFLKRIEEAAKLSQELALEKHRYGGGVMYGPIASVFAALEEKDREALLARMSTPSLRCRFAMAADNGDPTLARIRRELAELPADAVEVRRDLVRLSWMVMKDPAELLKEFKTRSEDESDPRLALEALMKVRDAEEGLDPATMRRTMRLLGILKAGGESDRRYAARYDDFLGTSRSTQAAVPGRWGAPWQHQLAYRSGGNPQQRLKGLLEMKDRPQAVREAAAMLEEAVVDQLRGTGSLGSFVSSLAKVGLLDDALSQVRVAEGAGLGRRFAALTLFDAGGRKAEAREVVAELSRRWPREARWTIELAIRVEDRAEAFALLSRAAEDPDFAGTLLKVVFPRTQVEALSLPGLERLADWADGPGRERDGRWIGEITVMFGNGTPVWMATPKNEAAEKGAEFQRMRELFGRYRDLGLARPEAAELVFRVLHATRQFREPQEIDAAAREVLLSGAYAPGRGVLMASRPGGRRLQVPGAPSALEHLVGRAAEEGDAVAFPAGFREALSKADPETDAWLVRLLAAKSALDLPGVKEVTVMQPGGSWSDRAKHEAAILRAVRMKGREDLLEELFHDNSFAAVSRNADLVLVASLADGVKAGRVESRLLLFLEAAAGPRKEWQDLKNPRARNYQMASQSIFNALSKSGDSRVVVEVVKVFGGWKQAVNAYNLENALGKAWLEDRSKGRIGKLTDLPGWKTADALKLGTWQAAMVDGKPGTSYQWFGLRAVRTMAQSVEGKVATQLSKEIQENPNASFMELLMVSLSAGNQQKDFIKRALKSAAPELAKAPVEVRDGVIRELSQNFVAEDLAGLPKPVADSLRKKLDLEKAQRIERAMRFRDSMSKVTLAQTGYSREVGRMVGSIASDDPELAAGIMQVWSEKAGSRRGRAIGTAELMELTTGMLEQAGSGAGGVFASLRILDGVWKDQPLSLPGPNAFYQAWQSLGERAIAEPSTWQGIAELSKPMQVRVLSSAGDAFSRRAPVDAKQRAALVASAKGSELLRSACAWCLSLNPVDPKELNSVDGKLLVAWLEAMKAAGAGEKDMLALVLDAYERAGRLEDPAVLFAATPGLLAEVKTLTPEEARQLSNPLRTSGKPVIGGNRRVMSYPPAVAGVLGFLLDRSQLPAMDTYVSRELSKVVVSLGDRDLMLRWVKVAAKGDNEFMIALLRQGDQEEALSLVPPAGRIWSEMQNRFSRETERMVASLAGFDTTEAFRLRVHLSMKRDDYGEEAPEEAFAKRKERLVAEFGERAKTMSSEERLSACAALELAMGAAVESVAVLDEFLDENPEAEFRRFLSDRSEVDDRSGGTLVKLGAACSAFHRGDTHGIDAFSAALQPHVAVRSDGFIRNSLHYSWLPLLQGTFWMHADRHDGVMPEESAKAVLRLASVVGKIEEGRFKSDAWTMVLLASPDAAIFERNRKEAGLPPAPPRPGPGAASLTALPLSFEESIRERIGRAKLRMSVLHPAATPEFVEAFAMPRELMGPPGRELELLAEEKLRAALPPARFLDWLRAVRTLTPEMMERAAIYANERHGDFDELQWKAWEERQAMPELPLPERPERRPGFDPRRR